MVKVHLNGHVLEVRNGLVRSRSAPWLAESVARVLVPIREGYGPDPDLPLAEQIAERFGGRVEAPTTGGDLDEEH